MKIEFFYAAECPEADSNFKQLVNAADNIIPDVKIQKILVTSNDNAASLKCYGIPSIHIDGQDLEYKLNRQYSMECRSYDGNSVIPVWLMEAGILRALKPKAFLFLCVANSARSQIGEGVAKKLAPDDVIVQSAGSIPSSVRPGAVTVLKELNIDTSDLRSKNVKEIDPATVDTVITLCAQEECPLFLGKAIRIYWGLPDPAGIKGSAEKQLDAFRKTRDELLRRLKVIFADV
jgi:arsenate reductase